MGFKNSRQEYNKRGQTKRAGNGGKNKGGAFGPGGFCLCAKCGTKVPHILNAKCTTQKCPECGHVMVREELFQAPTRK